MGVRREREEPLPCEPGSIEQQLDMCETGPLRGDEIEHHHGLREENDIEHNFEVDMAEPDREGAELSGDEHSSGYQGDEEDLRHQANVSEGLPGDESEMEAEILRKKSDEAA
jgi:hypothetical protein